MPVRVEGTCDPGFEPVRDVFASGFEERGELGAAVAVHLNGRLVAGSRSTTTASSGSAASEDSQASACGAKA
jgi:hypothetical protein